MSGPNAKNVYEEMNNLYQSVIQDVVNNIKVVRAPDPVFLARPNISRTPLSHTFILLATLANTRALLFKRDTSSCNQSEDRRIALSSCSIKGLYRSRVCGVRTMARPPYIHCTMYI
eukprot:2199960-Pyramimonas_sp.AAC.1